MQGSYEVEPCLGGRSGQCVQQTTPVIPIEWQNDSDAYALLGDTSWANYTVSSDVYLNQAGTVELYGRANTQQRPQSHQNAYLFRASSGGAWSIAKSDTNGTITTLTSGTKALGTGSWHTLALSMQGSTISASIDGTTVGSVNDSSYARGQVGIGVVGYQTDQFDNLTITPGSGGIGAPGGPITSGVNTAKCVDDANSSSTNGTKVEIWDCNGGANQSWTRATNGTIQINGKCMDITGNSTANGALVELWDCNGGGNQNWTLQNGTLVNPQSGRCLDDPGFNTTNGTQLAIWDCNNGTNQHWNVS